MTVWLSLSGGLDSTALLAEPWTEPVEAVTFTYGQRHAKEVDAAARVAAHYATPHRVIDLPRLSSPALTDGGAMPHGHYSDESMTATVVQGRNLLFIAALVGHTRPGDRVAVAVHSGDHAIYPDCRPEFIDPLAAAIAVYNVTLTAPYLTRSKADIVRAGARNHAPFALTWSCYEGGDRHCGRCGTCVERAEAFHLAGVPDPTDYADAEFWREATGR